MAAKTTRARTRKPANNVLRLAPPLVAPDDNCRDVAAGLDTYRQDAFCGLYPGALVIAVAPDGRFAWDAFGTLGNLDKRTLTAAAKLYACAARYCDGAGK